MTFNLDGQVTPVRKWRQLWIRLGENSSSLNPGAGYPTGNLTMKSSAHILPYLCLFFAATTPISLGIRKVLPQNIPSTISLVVLLLQQYLRVAKLNDTPETPPVSRFRESH
ncbi:hypothetical protein Pst134EA_002798 [Puccinia striiformis f. sp. tritici]|uniref:hypothetical protein n=1 Tax=Puccinia striiformis f. sp. tritici TaxID=168172 RepID=UPI0020088F44|nr:hypothetical protein Pst134EA_002798 [Puccinia striiformis f. sp. tritici]KAH9464363.1 hypothetical protein Pst134EB_003892 [Puccinia striiformis f. sp. tritici]KAH9472173.1 hypothetical protein Pst134EA_002798 [Puccinia striiformis f. sp. tritici]KAI9618138.1 hypothetical protein H4Q26_012482 [Puccinia striiformis f. sp. tritici PST-130]KAI9628136.1 hypothetical protein KEM48_011814 [Puccinia striiformis f. sp. tritici PST-130]